MTTKSASSLASLTSLRTRAEDSQLAMSPPAGLAARTRRGAPATRTEISALLSSTFPVSTCLTPSNSDRLKVPANVGLRRSASIRITRAPPWARATARPMEVVDLPSAGPDPVTSITRESGAPLRTVMIVRRVW